MSEKIEKGWDDDGNETVFEGKERLKTDPIHEDQAIPEPVEEDAQLPEGFSPTVVVVRSEETLAAIRTQASAENPVLIHRIPREAEEYLEQLLVKCQSGVSVGLPEMQQLKRLLA